VAIIEELDELDATAREIGAVNTVVNRGGRWIGYNTDGPGYLRSLREEVAPRFAEKEVILLGAGGAARAVGYALATAGARKITIANRTLEKAEALKRHLARFVEVDAIALDQAEEAVKRATLVVNTTSVGMYPHTEQMPIPGAWLHDGHIVSDLVYHPPETSLLREAKQKGARIHTGLGMLVHQAAIALELWLNEKAPVEWMKQVLEASLTGTNIKEA
jgi:shikimate dehydrogenase